MGLLRLLTEGWFRRSQMESEMAEELRFHIESRTEDLVRSGASPAEAARRARMEFGAVEGHKDSCREAKGLRWLDELHGDIRYTLRTLRKSPGFALVSVLSLAVGIGVNLSCFVTVNSIILHPFPYPHLERVMTVWETSAEHRAPANGRPSDAATAAPGAARSRVAPANFFDWRDNSRAFERLAAYRPWDVMLTGLDDPERVQAALATGGFFEAFGMQPAMGRSFTDRECEPGNDAVVVVSHAFWQNRLAGVREPIGRPISLGGRSFTVIGVMPEEFDFPLATELWAPLALSPAGKSQRGTPELAVMGRLKAGVPVDQARAEMVSLARTLEQRYPQTNEGRGVLITPLRELTNQVTDRFVWIILGAAMFVLLLACANIGNLQLARASARQKEMGLRAALGAGRFRIARQLLNESVVTAVAGGTLGLALAYWNLSVTKADIPAQVLQWVAGLRNMHLEPGVVLLGFGLSVAAGIGCCLPSIYQLLRERSGGSLNEALKEGGRSSTPSASRSRTRSALVVVEMALALVLLVAAGLMVRTFRHILAFNTGYDPKNLLTMEVSLVPANYRDAAQITQFYRRVVGGLEALSGIEAAGASGGVAGGKFSIEGRREPDPDEPRPDVRAITPRYFQAMRIPLLEGRSIGEQDGPDAPRVVVLSESLARHYWPDSTAIGQKVRLGGAQSAWLTVAGVCGDVKDWFGGEALPAAYVAYQQSPVPAMRLLARTVRDPMQTAGSARAVVRTVDRTQPLYDVKSMEQRNSEQTSGVETAATVMGRYAGIALLLAVMGSYAVGSFYVAQRKQEIGVRVALGATRGNILGMVLTETARTTVVGLAAGLTLALVLTEIMSHVLYGIVTVEPLTFVALTAVLGASAMLAGYVPARRAARVDPVVALRSE